MLKMPPRMMVELYTPKKLESVGGNQIILTIPVYTLCLQLQVLMPAKVNVLCTILVLLFNFMMTVNKLDVSYGKKTNHLLIMEMMM